MMEHLKHSKLANTRAFHSKDMERQELYGIYLSVLIVLIVLIVLSSLKGMK